MDLIWQVYLPFLNTISLKKVNNKIDIRDNIFEIEGLVGSLINFDLDGIYIYELYSNDDNSNYELYKKHIGWIFDENKDYMFFRRRDVLS